LPQIYARIEGAQAHGARRVLDCGVRVAEAELYPAADGPRGGQVRVEDDRAVDERSTIVEILDHVAKGKPGVAERDRVIPSCLDRPSSQPCCFGDLLRTVNHPAICFSKMVAMGGPRISQSEIRIAFDRLIELSQGLVIGLYGHSVDDSQPA